MKKLIAIIVGFLFLLPLASEAALQNYAGFETRDSSEATLTSGTLSMNFTNAKNGGGGLRVNPVTTATGVYKISPIPTTGAVADAVACTEPCALGFWFRVGTLPASVEEPIAAFNDNAGNIARITIRSDGKLGFYDVTGGNVGLGTTTTALSADTWYFIEAKMGSASTAYGVRINGGSEEISGTRAFGGNSVQAVVIGKTANMNSNSVDFYYDDFYFNDSDYLANATNAKVLRLQPNATSTTYYTDWGGTGSTRGNFSQVDEFPTDGSTTYASSTTSGESFVAYGMQDTQELGISGTVLGLKGYTRVFERAAGTSVLSAVLIRSGSTNSTTTAADPGTTAVTRVKLLETDPSTSAAWTIAGVNAVEIGANTQSDNAMDIRMSTVGAIVYFIPQSTPTLTNFSYCRQLTMTAGGDSGGVATTTTGGFALHASTTLATFAATSSGGRIQTVSLATTSTTTTALERPIDLIVTTDDNCAFSTATMLDFYTEKYSSTTGAIDLWLEHTDISSTTAKDVNIYYGYATTTEFQNRAGTFGALGEYLVYNMNESPASLSGGSASRDVTYMGRHSGPSSAASMPASAVVTGQVGDGLDFDGVNDQLQAQNYESTLNNATTISVLIWAQPDTANSDDGLVSQLCSGCGGWRLYRDDVATRNDSWVVFLDSTPADQTIVGALNSGAAGVRHHVGFTWETGSDTGLRLFVDGAEDANSPASTTSMGTVGASTFSLQVGDTSNSGTNSVFIPFDGMLDDVRVYTRRIHPMDVLTIYNNTKSSTVFWTFGAEQTQGSPGMTQLHYRWRNDDGSESGATWAKAEDTNLTSDFFPGDRKRLRFLISSTGGVATGNITYKLEHASSSCTTWVAVPAVSALVNEHFVIDTSSHFADGASTTDSSGLTNPASKTFNAGMAKSAGNSTNAIALTASQFTELEYTLKPTSNVSIGTTYCFRVTNAGSTTGFTYTAQPQAVVSAVAKRPTGGGSSVTSPGEASGSGSVQSGGGVGGGATTTPGGEGSGSGTPQGGGGTGGGGGDVGFLSSDNQLAATGETSAGAALVGYIKNLWMKFVGLLAAAFSSNTLSTNSFI